MYLTNHSLADENNDQHGSQQVFIGLPNEIATPQPKSFLAALLGDEKPLDILILLAVLVVVLHVAALTWLLQPTEKITLAKPLLMEVSMIGIHASKPDVTTAPPKPSPQIKSPQKKPPLKQILKKIQPIMKKTPVSAATEQVMTPHPIESPVQPQHSESSTSNKADNNDAEQFIEADFRANYALNPKPHYPPQARKQGLKGKVMLTVRVSTEGFCEHVAIYRSSGHDILDDSAVEAVHKWRFIPAKRGETAVASSVIVPINFNLRD